MVQLAKGVRDFAPQEKIQRNYLVDTLRSIFEKYGFYPLETPIIERFETLATKDSGAEILKEIFRFKDQGQRDLALRFDLTVPLARYIAMNPNIKMPFKRYQIGRVFRDGPIKLGRYREFWQCDADIIGSSGMIAEAEILNMTNEFFKQIGLNVNILINNRKLLTALIKKSGISEELIESVIQSIDKLEKIGKQEVTKELLDKGFDEPEINEVLRLIDIKDDNKNKLDYYTKIISDNEGLKELKQLFSLIKTDNIIFTPELARGLSYYTGTIFEVVLNKSKFTSSLAGGGRYDNMIGDYAANNKSYPAIGLAFGLEPILEVLKLENKLKTDNKAAQIFIIPIGDVKKECLEIAQALRESGIKVDIDLMDRKIGKNIQYAESRNIPYVLFAGEEEIANKKFNLKNITSGEEVNLAINDIIEKLK